MAVEVPLNTEHGPMPNPDATLKLTRAIRFTVGEGLRFALAGLGKMDSLIFYQIWGRNHLLTFH
jgi:hypothetical protein